jgi:hypothetical protein
MNHSEVENALMAQKDTILALIHSEEYEQAMTLLDFSERLWAAHEYAYKTRELRIHIQDKVRQHMMDATHHKTVEKWTKLYQATTKKLWGTGT